MKRSTEMIRKFLKEEHGGTAVEYSLMASLIAAVIVGTVTTLGGKTDGLFQTMSSAWP